MDEIDQKAELMNTAIRLLANREHSRAELRRKLSGRGDSQLIEAALDALAAQRLQSDERYAEQYVNSRRRKGFGPQRIRYELQERGIAGELIETAVDDADPQWRETLAEVYRRKFGQGSRGDFKAMVKIRRFLEYRGFSGEAIRHFLQGEE